MTLLNIVGAAALLLWGMRMVRTGMTRAYGADIRKAIGIGVANRFSAVLVGIGATALLQSSTATALMITSFAGRGLMATAPALAVMLGADIGTTLVAQVLSFDITWVSPMLILVGVAAHQLARKSLTKQLARVAIGLGLILLALMLIVGASEPMRDSPILISIFTALAKEKILAILIAALLTALAMSSLATVLLVMSFAASGIIDPVLAIVLVIGANIGGIFPPLIATLHEGAVARRVPIGNAIFKLTGAVVMLPLVPYIEPTLSALSSDTAHLVVNFHTLFNIAVAAVFILLTGPVAKLLTHMCPDQVDGDDPGQARYLDRSKIGTPALSLSVAARETLRMGEIVETMLRDSLVVFQTDDKDMARDIAQMDNAVDSLHEAIKIYMTKAYRARMDEDESHRAAEIMSFNTNLENIGDIVENLMDLAGKKIKNRMHLSEHGLAEIVTLHERVLANLGIAFGVFSTGDVKLARHLLNEKREIVMMERTAVESHMGRLMEGLSESIESSALHMDILRDLKRIHSHIVAVAYPVLEAAGELDSLRKRTEKKAI